MGGIIMIDVITTHDAVDIEQSGSSSGTAVYLNKIVGPDVEMFLDLTITGDGTVDVQPLLSETSSGGIKPSAMNNICVNHSALSGTSGRDIYKIDPIYFHNYLKINVVEKGDGAVAVIAKLIIVSRIK